jgi:HEAT repeat protein
MLHQALTLASAAVHEMSDEARLPVVPRIEQITRSATDLTGEANSIDVQEVGLVALAQVGGSSAITALGMQLTRTSSVQIADYIAGKIWEAAQRPDPGNASALERILSDGLIVWSSRSAVFQAIASLPRSQARDTLRHLVVGHLEDNIRLQAAKWLLEEPVASADPADLHVVADAFRSVLNQGHRWSAYEAIMFSVNLEHPIGVELLKETARTHTLDSRDRERLTDALRMSLSSDELVALLHDPDVESATLASYTALDTHGAFYPRASLTRDELLDIIGAVSDRNRPARSRCAAIGAIARQPWLFQGGASNEVSTKALSALTVAMTERLAGNLVRQCAAGAIAAMGGDEAAKVLIDASIQSEFKAVRAAANEALGHLVGPLAPSVMEALGELLQHRSSPRSLRCGLARTLSRGGGEVARGALLRAVGDESSDLIVRRAALKALGDFRRSQFSRVHDREVVDAIIEAAVVPAFTRTAMSALLMRCGPDYLPALAAIERVLREPTSTAASRQSAARALGRLGADRDQTVAALRRVLIDSGLDTDSRVVAAKVLGGLGSPLAAESLILGLRVPGNGHAINEAIAFEVYRTFNERRQDTRFIAALKNAAADPNLRAVDRMSIANTLRYIGELDENALATLRTSLTTAAKGNEAARAAAMTLGSMRDRATLTELLSAEGRPGDLAHMRHYVAGWQFGPITTDEPQDLMNLVVKATNSSDEGLREAARSIAYQRFTRITLPPRLRSPALLNMLFELS